MSAVGCFLSRATVVLLLCLQCLSVSAQTIVEYVHTDTLGSVVAITDASGQLVGQRRTYEPYGSQIEPSMQDGPGYTGHVQDAGTGLVYMQQRYYDPMLGVFLSVDPVTALDNGDMRHFNRYAYAYNNPYMFSDPDGRAGRKRDGGAFAELGLAIAEKVGLINPETAAGARAGVTNGKVKSSKPSPRSTSREARREAQRQAGVPTSRPATSQSGVEGRRQQVVEGSDSKPKIITQHPPDKDHPNPHWHAAEPKRDPVSGEMRTNKHGQVKYQDGGPSVEYKVKENESTQRNGD